MMFADAPSTKSSNLITTVMKYLAKIILKNANTLYRKLKEKKTRKLYSVHLNERKYKHKIKLM